MAGKKKTGWPIIGRLIILMAVGFCIWFNISGDTPQQFYKHWYLVIWAAGVLIGICILVELLRLKCPRCRSRAIILLAADEVDRWIGQKVVTEETMSIGGFISVGNPKFKGINGGLATTRRTIPVTKRRLLQTLCCKTCDHEFQRNVIEEMI